MPMIGAAWKIVSSYTCVLKFIDVTVRCKHTGYVTTGYMTGSQENRAKRSWYRWRSRCWFRDQWIHQTNINNLAPIPILSGMVEIFTANAVNHDFVAEWIQLVNNIEKLYPLKNDITSAFESIQRSKPVSWLGTTAKRWNFLHGMSSSFGYPAAT